MRKRTIENESPRAAETVARAIEFKSQKTNYRKQSAPQDKPRLFFLITTVAIGSAQ